MATPGAIWAEWIACGPLLVFLTLTLVPAPELSKGDIFIIVTFTISMGIGFSLLFDQPLACAWFWLIFAVLCYLPMFCLVIVAREHVTITEEMLARDIQVDFTPSGFPSSHFTSV